MSNVRRAKNRAVGPTIWAAFYESKDTVTLATRAIEVRRLELGLFLAKRGVSGDGKLAECSPTVRRLSDRGERMLKGVPGSWKIFEART
jgi:hypothetical protein